MGGATLAVLLKAKVAAGFTVAIAVYVAVPPTGRLTVSLILPAPAGVHVPPPAPTQVQVTPVSAAGKVSVTVAPVTGLGPAFEATIVYVIIWPGLTVATPSVFVIDKSAELPTTHPPLPGVH
jgi:hypothetical protein